MPMNLGTRTDMEFQVIRRGRQWVTHWRTFYPHSQTATFPLYTHHKALHPPAEGDECSTQEPILWLSNLRLQIKPRGLGSGSVSKVLAI